MCFLCQGCLWEWRQLWGCFVLHLMRGLKAASGGWMCTYWIDLRKEEHPRQIWGPVLPAKMMGVEILLGAVEFEIKASTLNFRWVPFDPHLKRHLGGSAVLSLPGKDTNLPLAAAVSCCGGLLLRCLVLTWQIHWRVADERCLYEQWPSGPFLGLCTCVCANMCVVLLLLFFLLK